MKKWKQLKTGDRIKCPRDGVTEKILFARQYFLRGFSDRVMVRTNRHDHYVPGNDEIEVIT